MEHERTLDEEGMPDLDGPLANKAATGDGQDGLIPPNDRPRASVDFGTTAAEQRHGESLDQRVAREVPEGIPPERDPMQLVDREDSAADGLDEEAELIADRFDADPGELLAPEEQAMHLEPEPD
jgi:hypothetical protein